MRKYLLALLAIAGLVVIVDAFIIEPYRIEVTHSAVEAPLTRPLKIALLADLHNFWAGTA